VVLWCCWYTGMNKGCSILRSSCVSVVLLCCWYTGMNESISVFISLCWRLWLCGFTCTARSTGSWRLNCWFGLRLLGSGVVELRYHTTVHQVNSFTRKAIGYCFLPTAVVGARIAYNVRHCDGQCAGHPNESSIVV
jgi:hypothetical protein